MTDVEASNQHGHVPSVLKMPFVAEGREAGSLPCESAIQAEAQIVRFHEVFLGDVFDFGPALGKCLLRRREVLAGIALAAGQRESTV
jgi:hypothetical protein